MSKALLKSVEASRFHSGVNAPEIEADRELPIVVDGNLHEIK
jgi:hypothetical protein